MLSKLWNSRNLLILSVLFYVIWQTSQFFFGERVLHANGFGWDGIEYAKWVSTFSFQHYFQHQLSFYYVQRILPSIIVHVVILIFHLNPHQPSTIVNTFLAINNFYMILVIIGLFNLSRHLNWTPAGTLIALTTLLFNFVILKQMTYYSVLTDYTAFAIGFFQIYFYIYRKTLPIYLLSIAGAFVWPTLLLIGLLLIIFEPLFFKNSQKKPLLHKSAYSPHKTIIFTALLSCAICIGIYFILPVLAKKYLFFFHLMRYLNTAKHPGIMQNGIPTLYPVSVFIVFLYFYYILIPVVKIFFNAVNTAKSFLRFWLRLLICLATYIAVFLFIHHVGSATIPGPEFWQFLLFFFFAISAPAKFLSMYVIYFGIGAVLLALIYRKTNFSDISGLGAATYFLLLIFALQIHSRFGTPFFPILGIILGSYFSKITVSTRFCFAYFILSFIYSFSWIPLNWPTSISTMQAQGPRVLFEWPWQLYFATQGMWTTNFSYGIELILIVILIAILKFFLKKEGEI